MAGARGNAGKKVRGEGCKRVKVTKMGMECLGVVYMAKDEEEGHGVGIRLRPLHLALRY